MIFQIWLIFCVLIALKGNFTLENEGKQLVSIYLWLIDARWISRVYIKDAQGFKEAGGLIR